MEILYNGIEFNEKWLVADHGKSMLETLPVPYLENPPEIKPIDIGRQLFVDDFLIEKTDMYRVFHQPETRDLPVLFPQTEVELNHGYCPVAAPFDDGLFYDEDAGCFKLWYHAGWFRGIGYAESKDGIHWKRLNEIDSSIMDGVVLPLKNGTFRDGAAAWLDRNYTDPKEKYKMFVYFREYEKKLAFHKELPYDLIPEEEGGHLFRSADGIHWEEVCKTSPCGDNSTFFYNPFRKKWVFSLRTFSTIDNSRTRGYAEADDFFSAAWNLPDVAFWARTDKYDLPDPDLGYVPQLYKLDATPYESLMLGMFAVFQGPPNEICDRQKRPKTIDLEIGFSRDGFHWTRDCRTPFLSASRVRGKWDYGYLHNVGGICCVVGDELYIYYSAWSGHSPRLGMDMYAGASMGLATLRRDGFASMRAGNREAELLTGILETNGKFLFINAESGMDGYIKAELLDETGQIIHGFEVDDCIPLCGSSTKHMVVWKHSSELEEGKKRLRIRFLSKNADIYSFWFADSKEGKSKGYLGAGGPGLKDAQDA